MQILQVLPHLSKGGAERVVIELSNALIEAGHQVTFLLTFPVDPALNQQYLDKRIKVQFASPNPTNRFLAYLKLPLFVARDWKVLRKYDVIHCHLTYGLVFGFFISFFRKITRVRNLRLIATCHMVGTGVSRNTRIFNERMSYFFDVFVLMAQDAQWRNFISAKKRANFKIVANGISAKMWMKNKLERSNNKSSWTVGTISRLHAERKPWLFLEVFSQVYKSMNCEVSFILGGEGPERESLIALSGKLKLSGNLSMPGLVMDPSVILEDLDLYVGLNVEEVTGIAGLEAVFSGVPVLSIQLSQTYTKKENDWIWSDQDPKIVAEKIVALLDNPNKLAEVAKEQYRVAAHEYSIERMRDNYLNLYTSEK
jgi:glycosyltransferase involved in cell wall biosynthesis